MRSIDNRLDRSDQHPHEVPFTEQNVRKLIVWLMRTHLHTPRRLAMGMGFLRYVNPTLVGIIHLVHSFDHCRLAKRTARHLAYQRRLAGFAENRRRRFPSGIGLSFRQEPTPQVIVRVVGSGDQPQLATQIHKIQTGHHPVMDQLTSSIRHGNLPHSLWWL